jgi:hypothetical protein
MVPPIDLFLTHAWRDHVDWFEMTRLLDASGTGVWRNFSLPWYDPALNPGTALGAKLIREVLEKQVMPVRAVIVLRGVYAVPSARKWVDMEMDFARTYGKPIISVPPLTTVADPCPPLPVSVDAECGWNAEDILETAKRLGDSRAALGSNRDEEWMAQ